MTSQIPFTPLTPESMGRLTLDEQLSFEAAACAVAGDQKPSLEVIATVVLTVQRLIAEEALSEPQSRPAADDTGQDSPASPEQARDRTGADPREPLVMPRDEFAVVARAWQAWIDGPAREVFGRAIQEVAEDAVAPWRVRVERAEAMLAEVRERAEYWSPLEPGPFAAAGKAILAIIGGEGPGRG